MTLTAACLSLHLAISNIGGNLILRKRKQNWVQFNDSQSELGYGMASHAPVGPLCTQRPRAPCTLPTFLMRLTTACLPLYLAINNIRGNLISELDGITRKKTDLYLASFEGKV
ncbi:hypothetical protein B0T24DRAFT_21444 [Lasiosphaeria ovina]|uniref:Uncharacterized protein n=1 Tax=Lasiosphaeria ovina TaxID=92902 RepID=A0AAE0NJK1_9PEZI|nr:hypothetical protein B0T24DRAFT_21444 [Lasiosphaeria ovina]